MSLTFAPHAIKTRKMWVQGFSFLTNATPEKISHVFKPTLSAGEASFVEAIVIIGSYPRQSGNEVLKQITKAGGEWRRRGYPRLALSARHLSPWRTLL